MALLDAPQAKSAMSGGPTLFGVPMKQASLITVRLPDSQRLLLASEAIANIVGTVDLPELSFNSCA